MYRNAIANSRVDHGSKDTRFIQVRPGGKDQRNQNLQRGNNNKYIFRFRKTDIYFYLSCQIILQKQRANFSKKFYVLKNFGTCINIYGTIFFSISSSRCGRKKKYRRKSSQRIAERHEN